MHRTRAARSAIRRSGLVLITGLAAASLLLAACSGSPSGSSTGSTGAADANATLTVGLVLEPTSLDVRHTSGAALEQVLVDNIYEGLVSRTQDDAIVDRLAKSHKISADGLTYTFLLNDGITFHDGAKLTSADVVSSLQTAKDDATVQGHADLAGVSSIAAPDDKTVVVTLAAPSQNFLFGLTGTAGLVFQKADKTDLQSAENGTGPFTLQKWNKGSSLSFSRNDAYWGKKAGVQTVVFDYIPDFTAGVNAAQSGRPGRAHRGRPEPRPAAGQRRASSRSPPARPPTRARSPSTTPRLRSTTSACARRCGWRSTTRRSSRPSAAGTTLYGPIPQLDPGYEDLTDDRPVRPGEGQDAARGGGAAEPDADADDPDVLRQRPCRAAHQRLQEGRRHPEGRTRSSSPPGCDSVFTKHDYDLSFVLHVEPRDFGNLANPNYYFGYDNPEVQKLYAAVADRARPEEVGGAAVPGRRDRREGRRRRLALRRIRR